MGRRAAIWLGLLGAAACSGAAEPTGHGIEPGPAAPTAPVERDPARLIVLCGPEGTGYASAAALLGALLVDTPYTIGIEASADAVADVQRLAEGAADLAFVTEDALAVLRGQGAGGRRLADLTAAAAPLPPQLVHLVARRKAHFDGYAGLVGERLGVGPRGSSTWLSAWRLLFHSAVLDLAEAAGPATLPYAEGVQQVGVGRLDVQFLTAPVAMPLLRELPAAAARNLELLSLPEGAALPRELRASYELAAIPAGTYSFQPRPVLAPRTSGYLLARRQASPARDALVEQLFAQADLLRAGSAVWVDLRVERVLEDLARGTPYLPVTLAIAGVEVE